MLREAVTGAVDAHLVVDSDMTLPGIGLAVGSFLHGAARDSLLIEFHAQSRSVGRPGDARHHQGLRQQGVLVHEVAA